MLTGEQLQLLKVDFPAEALKADVSRGRNNPLTSIRAAYITERLNDVFGTCGLGWRYAHAPFTERIATARSGTETPEMLTEVALQYRLPKGLAGCEAIMWDHPTGTWARVGSAAFWSEPIFTCGGRAVRNGGSPWTDARKGAITDGITKAASLLGIGHLVFKGQVTPPEAPPKQHTTRQRSTKAKEKGKDKAKTNGKATATEFWKLYKSGGVEAGIPEEVAKGLAADGDDWGAAIASLSTMIETALKVEST